MMEKAIRHGHNSNALIIFTREPEPGKTKTRMMPYLSPEQCSELHKCMLKDIAGEVSHADADIIVAYTGGEPLFLRSIMKEGSRFRKGAVYIEQRGSGIGDRMENAISDALNMGYRKAVLIGTDIPEIEAESIDAAFAMLDAFDVCLGPTEDGGYYLIGMKDVHHAAFDVKQYGVGTVYEETVRSMEEAALTVGAADMYADIDTPEDAAGYRSRMREDAHLRRSCTGRFLKETMRISVIVPVYNESGEIRRLLEQLDGYRNECEIIFVDGGSTDDTVSIVENAGFRILRSGKGRGIQMNAGALESDGDVLFFLHCVISNHRALFRSLPFGDQGIFIDRTVFFEAGMYPELPIMEDYAFSRKLKRYGFRTGMTGKRIISSARRYGSGTRSILKTEISMWRIRQLFRKGVSAEELQKKYRDIR